MWQHTSSLLILSAIILIALYSFEKPKLIILTGFLAGLAVLARPTNIVFALLLAVYVFFQYRKQFPQFVLAALPTVLFMLLYNYFVFGSAFIGEYQARDDTSFSTPLLEGLTGYLVSPSRSFLFVTPPLILSYYGMYKTFRKKNKGDLDKFLVFLGIYLIGTLLLLSKWWCWYGADRFGYGFLTEHIPAFAIFAFLVTQKFKKVGRIIILILFVYSFYTQFNAVVFRKSRCNNDHIWSFYCLQPPNRWPVY
jgi:hypothetical protein